jgi:succinate dehydrogenase / fumarate reductase cytochrome b subunit
MSLTGLALLLFLFVHLGGNLTLLNPNPAVFNSYSNSLEKIGTWIHLAEIALLVIAVIHVITALQLKRLALRARPIALTQTRTKGGPSKRGFSSTRLIYTGLIILVFSVVHVAQLRFGPGINEGYVTRLNGAPARDLFRLVDETFHKPFYAGFYSVCMVFLGFHLRHGIWSAFQSLGWTNHRTTSLIYKVGTWIALLVALGFFILPLWLYFGGPALGRPRP